MKIIEHLFLHEELWDKPVMYQTPSFSGFSFAQFRSISNVTRLTRNIEIDSTFEVNNVRLSSYTKVHGTCVMYLNWKEIKTLKKLNEVENQIQKSLGLDLEDYFPTEYIFLFKAGLK